MSGRLLSKVVVGWLVAGTLDIAAAIILILCIGLPISLVVGRHFRDR